MLVRVRKHVEDQLTRICLDGVITEWVLLLLLLQNHIMDRLTLPDRVSLSQGGIGPAGHPGPQGGKGFQVRFVMLPVDKISRMTQQHAD